MRIGDWSSDVCSSDHDCDGTDPKIPEVPAPVAGLDTMGVRSSLLGLIEALFARMVWAWRIKRWRFDRQMRSLREPGRARTSVEKGKSVSVRVALGGRRVIKRQHNKHKNRRANQIRQ